MSSPVKTKTYHTLKEMIVNFRLKPGEQLIESRLTEELKVSKTPIREALLMLTAEGFVEQKPYCGSYVKNISKKDIVDILELRECLEPVIVKDLVKDVTEQEIEEFEELIAKAEEAFSNKDFDNMARYIDLFQDGLMSKVKNNWIRVILINLDDHMKRTRTVTMHIHGLPEHTNKEHRAIIDAIKRRDVEETVGLTKKHIESVRKFFNESSMYIPFIS